jgi:diguanylate cyclase (GGDEF)-like protein
MHTRRLHPAFGTKSLRLRLLSLVTLAALPGFLAAAWTAYSTKRAADADGRSQLVSATTAVQYDFNDILADTKFELSLIMPLVAQDPLNCAAIFASITKRHPEFSNIGIIGANGHVQCSADQRAKRMYVGNRDYFRRALATEAAVVGDLEMDGLGAAPEIVVAQRMAGDARQIQRIAFIALNAEALSGKSELKHLPAGSVITFADRLGYIVASAPDHPGSIGQRIPETRWSAIMADAIVPDIVKVHLEAAGADLWAYARLPAESGNGFVIIRSPRNVLYEPAWLALRRSLTITALGLLGVLALAWAAGARPLLQKTAALGLAARRLAEGDLSARTGLPVTGDEIGAVAGAFDAMAGELQRRHEERENYMREIERLNRIYIILTAINAAILRISDTRNLLDETCRIAVEIGGFPLAWVGEVDPVTRTLKSVSWAGSGAEHVANFNLPLDADRVEAKGPAVTAAREGRVVVVNRFMQDSTTAAWHELGLRLGIRSAAAFPLSFDESSMQRVLALYAAEENYFEAEELRLLEQLSQDAALGLHRIATEQALAHASTHDAVTGLPNQTLLEDRLEYAIASARSRNLSLAVIVLDVGFQRIASQIGWHATSDFLRQTGREIAALLREGDVVGCLPGARFAIALVDLDGLAIAQRRSQQMLDRVGTATAQAHPEIVLPGLRAGVSVFPADGDRAAALLDRAQVALLAARDAAVPLQFFAPEVNIALQENRRLERYLRDAIENGELSLHYQPIIEVASGRLRGFEALARWTSPDLGEIPPAKFIPVAENSGLIGPIGEWALAAAARQAFAWQRAGATNLRIALNISPWQLRDPGFPERAGKLLAGLGGRLEGVTLAMEITESQLITDIDSGIAFLTRLKALGIALYVDDFGTGYSSLSYLHRLPVDALKIDKSFTERLETSLQSRSIVQSIIALAAALDLAAIAEGIERQDQLDVIRRLGCRYAQGFLLGRPVASAAAEGLWRHGAPH